MAILTPAELKAYKAKSSMVPIELVAGEPVNLRVEFFDKSGAAELGVTMQAPGWTECRPLPTP